MYSVLLLIAGVAGVLWTLALLTNFRGYRDRNTARMEHTASFRGQPPPDPTTTKALQIGCASIVLVAALVLVGIAVVALAG